MVLYMGVWCCIEVYGDEKRYMVMVLYMECGDV